MAAFLILEPRCVFLHVPKTGGSSIRLGFFENNVEGPQQGSIPEQWQDLFTFTFVRHPLDRLVSAWQMFAGGMENSVWEWPEEHRDISLGSFLDIARDDSIPFDGRRETSERKIRHHALPQTHEFHCLEQADFVGKFESLNEDFKTVLKRLDFETSKSLPHWNKTNRESDFLKYFSAEELKSAVEFYREDFEQLGYAFP